MILRSPHRHPYLASAGAQNAPPEIVLDFRQVFPPAVACSRLRTAPVPLACPPPRRIVDRSQRACHCLSEARCRVLLEGAHMAGVTPGDRHPDATAAVAPRGVPDRNPGPLHVRLADFPPRHSFGRRPPASLGTIEQVRVSLRRLLIETGSAGATAHVQPALSRRTCLEPSSIVPPTWRSRQTPLSTLRTPSAQRGW